MYNLNLCTQLLFHLYVFEFRTNGNLVTGIELAMVSMYNLYLNICITPISTLFLITEESHESIYKQQTYHIFVRLSAYRTANFGCLSAYGTLSKLITEKFGNEITWAYVHNFLGLFLSTQTKKNACKN